MYIYIYTLKKKLLFLVVARPAVIFLSPVWDVTKQKERGSWLGFPSRPAAFWAGELEAAVLVVSQLKRCSFVLLLFFFSFRGILSFKTKINAPLTIKYHRREKPAMVVTSRPFCSCRFTVNILKVLNGRQ